MKKVTGSRDLDSLQLRDQPLMKLIVAAKAKDKKEL